MDNRVLVVGELNVDLILSGLASFPVLGAFIYAVMKKRGWESHEEKYLAKKRIITILANSTGSRLKGPKLIQLVAPLTTLADKTVTNRRRINE